MFQPNLYQQYKTQSLETLTKGEIVVKLFEETSKQISTAIFLIKNDQSPVNAYNAIAKAQKIISNLNFSLDMRFAISIDLRDMYQFIFEQLGEANAKRDVTLMKDILALVDDLKVTFREAEKLARIQQK
ncbi:MAG: flagellar export chaperone FliS [Eubacteriales bacterium]|nr:flagellar export chaperone FliS [Eubacteriales bacterium]MDD4390102.1 flagellar export chaperone FliS [Eubacteriales bacterium]